MLIGQLSGNIRQLAALIARRANLVEGGILVWSGAKGSVNCAHIDTVEARQILAEASALIVGTYAIGAIASDINDDLHARRREVDE